MAKARKKPKDEKRFIPIYFQTFGDMMMNMLTLFILLCSFAKERQAAFFAAGVGSFINAIESYGLPGLLPSDTKAVLLDAYDYRFRAPMEEAAEEEGESTSYDSMDGIETEEATHDGNVEIPGAILFERGRAQLSSESRDWLREQLVYFQRDDFDIEVIGHAWKEVENREAARKLSLNRAYAVIAFLNEVGGIPLGRMHALAYGESRPLAEGKNDPGVNRRVNIMLIKSR
ncbi:MAG: OmpA family protein [Planctomycetota bacterium]